MDPCVTPNTTNTMSERLQTFWGWRGGGGWWLGDARAQRRCLEDWIWLFQKWLIRFWSATSMVNLLLSNKTIRLILGFYGKKKAAEDGNNRLLVLTISVEILERSSLTQLREVTHQKNTSILGKQSKLLFFRYLLGRGYRTERPQLKHPQVKCKLKYPSGYFP